MEKKDEEMVLSLLNQDAELKEHYEEHLELERQLVELNRRLYLTPEQEIEKKQIQKRKLQGKDRIMEILDRYRNGSRGANA